MAQFIYIDETGSVGTGSAQQLYLTLVAVLVGKDNVRPLELHGHEIWGGTGWWSEKQPPELIATYEAVISLLDELNLCVAHSSIDKARLHARYSGSADANAYRLALQFLLEKVDLLSSDNKILVADEAKEEQLRAVKMVDDMQQWGGGEVPGRRLQTVIDSLHFVRSNASPGVQLADLVAYVLQRARRMREGHPEAEAAIRRLADVVNNHTVTWREPWPAAK